MKAYRGESIEHAQNAYDHLLRAAELEVQGKNIEGAQRLLSIAQMINEATDAEHIGGLEKQARAHSEGLRGGISVPGRPG